MMKKKKNNSNSNGIVGTTPTPTITSSSSLRQRKKNQPKKREQGKNRKDNDNTLDRTTGHNNDGSSSSSSSSRTVLLIFGMIIVIILATMDFGTSPSSPHSEPGGSHTDNNNNNNKEDRSSSSRSSSSDRQQRREMEGDNNNNSNNDDPYYTEVVSFLLLQTVPHDPGAFTQGLTFPYYGETKNYKDSNTKDDEVKIVYESTGMYGASEVRKVNIISGEVLQKTKMNSKYFGEGMATFPTTATTNTSSGGGIDDNEERLIQLTWKEKTGLIYNITNLNLIKTFQYKTTTAEGWGITYNEKEKQFIVSDGSEYLHFWDATSSIFNDNEITTTTTTNNNNDFDNNQRIPVHYRIKKQTTTEEKEEEQPTINLKSINELQYDTNTNTVLANVWYQDIILRINPHTGFVLKIYDFRPLYKKHGRSKKADCFNGISIDNQNSNSHHSTLWVTGKYWPNMYQVRIAN